MGGLISMYAICEYPLVFGGAACLSTHWTGIYTAHDNPLPNVLLSYFKAHVPSARSHKLYFDYGTKTLDTLYKPFQLQADKIMKAKGYSSDIFVSSEFVGADHSERSWNARFAIPALFLLKK
jgi:hypothetical protein